MITSKRICVIQQAQNYYKPPKQPLIESNITNRMYDPPFKRLKLLFLNTSKVKKLYVIIPVDIVMKIF